MHETLGYLLSGFSEILTVVNMLWLFGGGLLGTIIGMLPGLGPATGVAVLIPVVYGMNPTTALITLCAIYYGAMFGGSRASILLNTPGDGSAVASTFDGYPMTKNGEAGAALAMAAIASFIGGIIAVIAMTFLAQSVANIAIKFGPPQYFALMLFALSATISVSSGSMTKGLLGLIVGLMLATVGIDLQTGVSRFTFGIGNLFEGVDFLVVIIGIYAVGEVLSNLETITKKSDVNGSKQSFNIGRVWVTRKQMKKCWGPILRATPVGFLIGILPGAGGTMASMMAYNNEKQLSKHPEKFGEGAIEGLAAPEAANNAASVGALIPMLAMGIPGSGTTAVMLGALLMLGVQPGPLLFSQRPEIAWGVIASMFIGNIMLAIINIPLATQIVKILKVPGRILMPVILILAFIGTYTMNYSVIDFMILIIFGIIGFYIKKFKVPVAPFILAVILGGKLEQSFRQSLALSDMNFNIFVGDWISIFILIAALFSIIVGIINTPGGKKWLSRFSSKKIGKT